MSVTERLRKLLDERGVKYGESTQSNTTFFRFDYRDSCGDYLHTIAITGACISAYSDYLTPEQAIAATLGGGKLTAEQVREVVEEHMHDFGNDWQAIADELNTTLENETCRYVQSLASNGWADWTCDSCGNVVNLDVHVEFDYNYCPECGKAVKQ